MTLEQEHAQLERIKIAALAGGLQVDDNVLSELGGPASLTIHEYATTGGITLELPHGVMVNAPFDEPMCAGARLRLVRTGDTLALELDEDEVEIVRVVPLPGYLDAVDDTGTPVTDTAMSHADRIRVSPIVGCAYDCAFCDLAGLRYQRRPVDQLIRAIDIARRDTTLPTRHLMISGGSPGAAAAHQQYFADACEAIVRHVTERSTAGAPIFDVDIMMSPTPDGAAFIDRMIDAGVTGFSINVEAFSDDAGERHLPRKHRLARPHLERMIRHAVDRLGVGAVRSLIIIGLEPIERTLAGVTWLTDLGCDPVLSPFRPARATALADAAPPDEFLLAEALAASREIVDRAEPMLGPRCVPCQHNTLTFPWDIAADTEAA